jgi:hypothetical protein
MTTLLCRMPSCPGQKLKLAFVDMADHRAPLMTRRKSTVVWTAVALLVLAAAGAGIAIGLTGGGSSSTSDSPPSAHKTSLPEVESCTGQPGAVVLRPRGIGCGLDAYVSAVHWTSWTPTSASGTGTFHQDTCIPDCAIGAFKKFQVSVSLSDPGDWVGHLVFEDIIVIPLSGRAPIEHVTGQTGSAWGAT